MIGSTIRSANRNASTPAKEIPPDHKTAASGTLPIEQTKLSTAMIGPTITFSIVVTAELECLRNRLLKNPLPSWAMNPARKNPIVTSL